uniref:Uncharacterized protein n=1 Tax=Avena sativa TaxID=4498 RepID=A0ACD5VZF2_AVESA
MEGLSEESKALYELLKADTSEEYDKRFAEYRKEVTNMIKPFVADTGRQLKTVTGSVVDIRSTLSADLVETKAQIGEELDSLRNLLSSEIAQLTAAIGRIARPDPDVLASAPSASHHREPGESAAGLDGRRCEHTNRGLVCVEHTPPPVGGMHPGRNPAFASNSSPGTLHGTDAGHAPRTDLPQFDGSNPKLWQRRCEDHFQRWQTPDSMWATYASEQFIGAAATWLESYLQLHRRPNWSNFVAAVMARFSRNQHQILARRLIHITQDSTVEDYVSRFSALMDHIAAYEPCLDQVHYTTKFLDGLRPGVRLLVALQQPRSLDTTYSLALLYEELEDDCAATGPVYQPAPVTRRTYQPSQFSPAQPPPPPSRWVSKLVEEKKAAEGQKQHSDDNKWQSLKAYRRSKGLCFVCGERWGRDHQCRTSVPLHLVQEMVHSMQLTADDSEENTEPEQPVPDQQLLVLSSAAIQSGRFEPRTMKLQVQIQGHEFLFLVDSGSSACFIDKSKV